jgi:acylphosphatase
MKPEESIELHAIFRGRVQGVGFRATARHYAKQLGVKGTVKNLSDGTVELLAQGSQETVLKLVNALKEEMGEMIEVDITFRTPNVIHDSFQIII